MTENEWKDIHYYSPSNAIEEKDGDTTDELH